MKYYRLHLDTNYCGTVCDIAVKSEEEIKEDEAWREEVASHADSYSNLYHGRSEEEIMEEDGVSEEEASEIWWEEYEEDFLQGAYDNSYIREISEEEYNYAPWANYKEER